GARVELQPGRAGVVGHGGHPEPLGDPSRPVALHRGDRRGSHQSPSLLARRRFGGSASNDEPPALAGGSVVLTGSGGCGADGGGSSAASRQPARLSWPTPCLGAVYGWPGRSGWTMVTNSVCTVPPSSPRRR